MKTPLTKNGYSLGYNTRDNPQDLPTGASQSLINMFPGSPNPRSRGGITPWNQTEILSKVDDIIPWPDVEIGDRLLVRIADSWYQLQAGVSALEYIGAGFPSTAKITFVRVRDAVYIMTDDATSPSWIIQKDTPTGATFTLRKGNIERPDVVLTATRTGAGNIAVNTYVGYAVTFINRNDADSKDLNGDPILVESDTGVFNPGILESTDNVAERVVFNNATVGGSTVRVQAVTGSALDPQATHMRVYRTEEAASAAEAEGLTYRWDADVPVKGPFASGTLTHTYQSNKGNTTIGGILDALKVVGYSAIPEGAFCFFHQGRLWVGGLYSGERIGRWYYSEAPQDVEFPQKWFSMFKADEFFKDTCLDASEDSKGINIAGNDLYFWMRNSLWYLRDGDPDFEPILIEGSWGTTFPKSITRFGDAVGYLSMQGPAKIQNRGVEPMKDFTAGEVWPVLHDGRRGYFHTLAESAQAEVIGWYFEDTWFLGSVGKWIGHHMPANGLARGPFEVAPASQNMLVKRVAVMRDTCIVLYATPAQSFLWKFLDKETQYDNDRCYSMESKSKAFYVNLFNPEQIAELFDILFFARWTDAARMSLRIIGDYFRFNTITEYKQFAPGETPLAPRAQDSSYRNVIQQGFEEGLAARHFEVEWSKQNKYPFDFQTRGFTMRVKKMLGYGYEYFGGNQTADERSRHINDAGEAGEDRSAFQVSDAGGPDRDLCDYTVKDAQVRS